MSRLWLVVAGLSAALLVSGCSSDDKSSGTTASASSGSTEDASAADPVAEPLDVSSCVDVTSASLGLLIASSKDEAQTAADTLEKFNPPAKAKAAIEHFVSTGGAHIDDADYDKNNKAVTDWVHQLCPPN
jgi:uncharacterized lipoprotein